VDIFGKALHAYCLSNSSIRTLAFNEEIYWLQPTHKNQFVAAFESGIWLLDCQFNKVTQLLAPLKQANMRYNDAKVDAKGRLWFGTMDNHEARPDGNLYLYFEGRLELVDQGYLVTNGPAFSTDGSRLYHNDTGNKKVYCFDVSLNGALTNKQVFIDFNQYAGFPDGMTVDENDHIWIAHWSGGGISQFSPEGQQIQFIELPVKCPTSLTFAGEELDRLFVTSAAIKDSSVMAGSLFEVQINTKGFKPNLVNY